MMQCVYIEQNKGLDVLSMLVCYVNLDFGTIFAKSCKAEC